MASLPEVSDTLAVLENSGSVIRQAKRDVLEIGSLIAKTKERIQASKARLEAVKAKLGVKP